MGNKQILLSPPPARTRTTPRHQHQTGSRRLPPTHQETPAPPSTTARPELSLTTIPPKQRAKPPPRCPRSSRLSPRLQTKKKDWALIRSLCARIARQRQGTCFKTYVHCHCPENKVISESVKCSIELHYERQYTIAFVLYFKVLTNTSHYLLCSISHM